MKTKLLVIAAAGRMGKRIVALAVESGDFELIGATEKPGHPDIGKDAGLIAGVGEVGIKISPELVSGADVVIDFSLPDAAETTLKYCVGNKAALVLGTTGLSDGFQEKIKASSSDIPIVYGTNMSIGMNVLFDLAAAAAEKLGEDYDIEIVEHHHQFKKDSPSGSALTLAESICNVRDKKLDDCLVCGREGRDAARKPGEIGVHSVRAGDITGMHSVIYSTLGETITLNHTAHNRDGFARGALRAAKWLAGRDRGLYTMREVLGLK
jgi:4-hydroxy-tetrahydrodipicolinate reductase